MLSATHQCFLVFTIPSFHRPFQLIADACCCPPSHGCCSASLSMSPFCSCLDGDATNLASPIASGDLHLGVRALIGFWFVVPVEVHPLFFFLMCRPHTSCSHSRLKDYPHPCPWWLLNQDILEPGIGIPQSQFEGNHKEKTMSCHDGNPLGIYPQCSWTWSCTQACNNIYWPIFSRARELRPTFS